MNRQEFIELVGYMRVTFERVNRWLDTIEKDGRKTGLLDIWFKILKDTDRKAALDACDRLLLEENKPKSAEDYPVRIRKMSRESRSNATPQTRGPDGEPTYACKDCLGESWISVFPQGTNLEKRMTELYGSKVKTMRVSVRCPNCRPNNSEIEAYNPNTMVKWSPQKATKTRETTQGDENTVKCVVGAEKEPIAQQAEREGPYDEDELPF